MGPAGISASDLACCWLQGSLLWVAHGPPADLAELSKPPDPATEGDSPCLEDPARDSGAPPDPGRGLEALREEAFCPRGCGACKDRGDFGCYWLQGAVLRVAHEPPPDLKPADPAEADSPCPGCVTAAVEEDLAEDPRAPPEFGRG